MLSDYQAVWLKFKSSHEYNAFKDYAFFFKFIYYSNEQLKNKANEAKEASQQAHM